MAACLTLWSGREARTVRRLARRGWSRSNLPLITFQTSRGCGLLGSSAMASRLRCVESPRGWRRKWRSFVRASPRFRSHRSLPCQPTYPCNHPVHLPSWHLLIFLPPRHHPIPLRCYLHRPSNHSRLRWVTTWPPRHPPTPHHHYRVQFGAAASLLPLGSFSLRACLLALDCASRREGAPHRRNPWRGRALQEPVLNPLI